MHSPITNINIIIGHCHTFLIASNFFLSEQPPKFTPTAKASRRCNATGAHPLSPPFNPLLPSIIAFDSQPYYTIDLQPQTPSICNLSLGPKSPLQLLVSTLFWPTTCRAHDVMSPPFPPFPTLSPPFPLPSCRHSRPL